MMTIALPLNAVKKPNQYQAYISVRIGNASIKISIHPALLMVVADNLKSSKYVDDDHQAKLAAKTAIGRYAACWIMDKHVFDAAEHSDRTTPFSTYCNNKLMSMLFHESLMTDYKTDQYGFNDYACQLPSEVLKSKHCGDSKVALHPAMAHAIRSLAVKLNIPHKDIVNYFMWLYTLNPIDKENEATEKTNNRSFNFRNVVIQCLRKDKFDLHEFEQNIENFFSIRESCILDINKSLVTS